MTNFFFLGHDNVKVRFNWPQLQHIPYAMDFLDSVFLGGDEEFVLNVPLLDAPRLIHLRNLLEAVIVTEVDLSAAGAAAFVLPGLDVNCRLPRLSYTAPWSAAVPGWPHAFSAALGAFSGADLLDLFTTTSYLGMWNLRKAVGYRILWRLAGVHRDAGMVFEEVDDTWTDEEFREGVAGLPFGCQTMLLYLHREVTGAA